MHVLSSLNRRFSDTMPTPGSAAPLQSGTPGPTIRERLADAQERHARDVVKVLLSEREHEIMIAALNIAADFVSVGANADYLALMSRLESL